MSNKIFLGFFLIVLLSSNASADVLTDAEALNALLFIENENKPCQLMGNGVVDGYVDETCVHDNTDNELYATTILDSGSSYGVMKRGDAELSAEAKKFGNASVVLDGTGDYLEVNNSTAWDVFGNTTDNWTIDFWVKHDNTSGEQEYIGQCEDTSNFWGVVSASGSLRFKANQSGSVIVDTGYGGTISDTEWHHVAAIKVGDEYALYLDGQQESYTQDTSTDTYSVNLKIGYLMESHYLDGYLDEIRIEKSNIFSAQPNSSETDRIVVPHHPHEDNSDTKLLVHADGSYYQPRSPYTMSILSNTYTAETEPTKVKMTVFAEDTSAKVTASNITAKASCDSGGNSEVTFTLVNQGESQDGIYVLSDDTSITCASGEVDMEYDISTSTSTIRVHGVALSWE
jgi:hypothetical protein